MDQAKKKQFIRDFKKLPKEKQIEIVRLLREFERVMETTYYIKSMSVKSDRI